MVKHRSIIELQEQSKWCSSQGKPVPKKAKTVISTRKVFATLFWYFHDIIFIDNLEKRKMITGQYYASLLFQFHNELMKKWPHFTKHKILFRHDSTNYMSTTTMTNFCWTPLSTTPSSTLFSRFSLLGFSFPLQTRNDYMGKYSSRKRRSSLIYFVEFEQSYFSVGLNKTVRQCE